MASGVPRPGDAPDPMEALNEVLEAWLEFAGRKQSREFLRSMASRLAVPPEERVIALHRPRQTPPSPATSAWLQERLPAWLSRHG